MAVAPFTTDRSRLFDCMTRFTHPVGIVFAESFNVSWNFIGFPVALLTIAFLIRLMRFVGERNTIFEFESVSSISSK
jgi:hypothetical protein